MDGKVQADVSLRELGSRVVRYLRANLARSLVMSAGSFVVGWAANVYVMAVRYEGSAIGPGGTATSPGNIVQGGMYWGVLTTIIFSLLAYGRQAGWRKLRDDLLSLPGILKSTFSAPAHGAWSMLLWGAAISLAVAVLIGPAVAGALGAGLLLMAPSPISGILGRMITRLWIGVLGVVSPANKHRVGGLGGTIAGVTGTAAGMALAWRTVGDTTKIVMAIGAAAVAYLITTRKVTPQGAAGLFLLGGGLLVIREVFEGVALADDGGWTECGECSMIDWSRSPGAGEVIRSGSAGGAAAGAGAALGTGLGGAVAGLDGGQAPPRPDGEPPGDPNLPARPSEAPPLVDEHGDVMEVSDGSQLDAEGNPIPPGLVRWDVGDETRWVSRDEAIDLVQEAREAAARTEQFDREVAANADAWEAESRERTAARRAQEEAAARERLREREELERWGERIGERDALVQRQDLLEADSARKNTDEGWWDVFYDEYQRGVQEDVSALPGELHDMFGNAVRKVAEELGDGENWRVLGETLLGSAQDLARVAAGDPTKTREVAENIRAGIERTAEVAGTLYAAAENDPSGAAVAVARTVLGVDNWEKVFDKDTPVGERFGRAVWGTVDTGGVILGAGAAAVGVVDKVGDVLRAGDAVSDAARVVDAAGDAARAADKVGDAARAADATGDVTRAGDAAADAARGSRLTPEELLEIQRREDALRAQRGTAGRQGPDGPNQPRTPYQDPEATRRAAAEARMTDARMTPTEAVDAERARHGWTTPVDEMTDAERVTRQRWIEAEEFRRGQHLDSRAVGTTADDYIHNLPEGAILDQNLAHHTGWSGEAVDGLRTVAREENVVAGARLTNMESMRHVRDGTGIPKPLEVKSKTIGELDTFLGAGEADRGLVGLFQPSRSVDEAVEAAEGALRARGEPVPNNLREIVAERHQLRSDEWGKFLDDGLPDGMAVDSTRGVVTNADGVPYAGDIDPVFFRDATTGEYLSGDRYLEVVDAFKRSGAQGQHGAEINLLGDLTRGMEPGSPEWHEAYDNAVKLQDKLGATHTSGSELVVEMGPDGILRRGTHMGGGLPDVEGVRDVAASLTGGGL